MKKIYSFLFAALCVSLYSNAQQTLKAKLQSFSLYNLDFQPLKNDDVLYAERIEAFAGLGIKLSRFSSKGELLWCNTFAQNLSISWLTTNKTADDGALVLASYQDGQTGQFNFLVFKCDKAGKIIWQTAFTESDYYNDVVSQPTICEAKDGSIYVGAGDLFNFFQIVKFNNSGQLQWHKRFDYQDGLGHGLDYITTDENSNVLLSIGYPGCDGYCGYSVILKVGKNGTPLWNQQFPQNFDVRSFEAIGDDKLSILFSYTPYGKNNTSYIKSIFNHTTGTAQSSIFAADAFTLASLYKKESANYAKGIKLDNFYIRNDWSVVRQYRDTVYSYDAQNRICPNYTIPKLKAVKDTIYSLSTRQIPALADTAFSLVAVNLKPKAAKPGVAITCQGKAPENVNVAASAALQLSIYPNPVNNQFTLQGLGGKAANLQIFTLDGLLIQEVKNYTGGVVNITKLKAGNYMLKILSGTTTYNKAFLKQ